EHTFLSAILYFGLLVSSAFGRLIAAGVLAYMDEAMGVQPWRWPLHFHSRSERSNSWNMQGFMKRQPHNTRWTSSAERRLAQMRLAEDVG
ncbi:hypothetical protein GLOTRDRAFT_12318, partial [Gloeophyllum trabeum ATCC 11539]